MMGWQGYAPEARGIKAALPHVDLYAPANTLNSLTRARTLSGEAWMEAGDDTLMSKCCDLVAQMKAAEQAVRAGHGGAHRVGDGGSKAGAKAIIRPDGTIVAGWIGGGCARGAVLKAAREALADGEPRMVSVQPEDLLAELGVKPGESSRRRALRQQHVPEQGHHGYLRRAGAAASRAGRSSARARWRCRSPRRRGRSAIT